MAEEKDDKPKSRAAKLYDKSTKRDRADERKGEEKAVDRKAEDRKDESKGMGREHAEMFKRHENERRDMHGRHRSEHRAIEEGGAGPEMVQKKISAHHRHRQEMDQMHEKHEKELIDKLEAMHAPGTPAGKEIAAADDKEAA